MLLFSEPKLCQAILLDFFVANGGVVTVYNEMAMTNVNKGRV